MPATLDHVTIVTDDFEASRPVYDVVLASIGMSASVDYADPEEDSDDTGTVAAIGYGRPGTPPLVWLVAGLVPTTGAHLALAATRAQVLAAYQAASTAGVRVVQPPRDWEASQLGYFGAQFADRAGNVLEVVCRS